MNNRAIMEDLHSLGAEVGASAGVLLSESCQAIAEILAEPDSVQHAILSGFHALITKLDSIAIFQLEALHDLRDSLDSQAGASAHDDAGNLPTQYESEQMLGALKADWLRRHPEHTQDAYRDAMRRFEILAGL